MGFQFPLSPIVTVEEPVEIVDRQIKKLKRSWIPIVKVRWDSRRGAEFTWEREDQFKAKASCGELDAQPSPPDEGVMTFLRKKVKTGAVVGKRVLLQVIMHNFEGWKLDGYQVDGRSCVVSKMVLVGQVIFFALNRALIFKWVWRFRTQGNSTWVRVIKALHGEAGNLGCLTKANFPSNWSNIIRSLPNLHNKGIDLLGVIKKKVGNGESTRFWEDPWRGEVIFKDLYPRLYALETIKSISVANKMAQPLLSSSFRRTARGGTEQHQMGLLQDFLEGLILPNVSDRWVCSLTGDGEFSVSSVRNLIDEKTLGLVGTKTRWSKFVPIKVNILSWKVKHDNLATRLNLSRRGLDLPSIFCPMCNIAVESSDHLFFKCSLTKDLYTFIARWWDVSIPEFFSYDDWWEWICNLRLNSTLKLFLESVFYTSWWLIWNFRNKSIFGSSLPLKARLCDDVVGFSFIWCNSRCWNPLEPGPD
ncbi:RNA-directed DNA polymerase, eukaryota, reverse transcriptase zinc-binding domain protein [Tanacetum coccineum]